MFKSRGHFFALVVALCTVGCASSGNDVPTSPGTVDFSIKGITLIGANGAPVDVGELEAGQIVFVLIEFAALVQ